jgi:hypothetical protein
MPLICLFGPDGAGKTSLARTLKVELARRGFRAQVSWMRGTHTFASLLARMMARFPSLAGSDNPYYHISIPKRLLPMWQSVEFVSMLPVLLARFLLPSLRGNFVIAERYIPDFFVWVTLTTNDSTYFGSFSARFLLSLLSKTGTKFYVTAEYAELVRRRSDVAPTFLKGQLDLYDRLAKAVGASKLDTTWTTADESAKVLIDLVDRKLARRGHCLVAN